MTALETASSPTLNEAADDRRNLIQPIQLFCYLHLSLYVSSSGLQPVEEK